jgi:hypothetical protein
VPEADKVQRSKLLRLFDHFVGHGEQCRSLSFPADLSAASAGLMESFIKLAVEQAKQQAARREAAQKKNEAAN